MMDGDTLYAASVLRLTHGVGVYCNDHPGTPAITLYGIMLSPVKIIISLYYKRSFSDWLVLHWDGFWIYFKFLTALFFGIGMWAFLSSIYLLSGSLLVMLLAWLILAGYSWFPQIGTYVSAEAIGFFIISL